MARGINTVALFCALAATLPAVVLASPPATYRLLSLKAGHLGLDRSLDNRGLYEVELRLQPLAWKQVVPAVGFAVTEADVSLFYVGMKKDFFLSPRWYVTPGFGVAAFNETPEFRLGHVLEFRSGVEAGYRFVNHCRIGLAVFHLSNGGISDENPGTEIVLFSLSIPL